MGVITSQEYFNMAKGYYTYKSYEKAYQNFELAAQDPKLHSSASGYLASIDLRRGDYTRARNIIDECCDTSNVDLKSAKALLESIEYNYDRSLELYYELFDAKNGRIVELLHIANTYRRLGEYDMAIKMLETLQLHAPCYYIATISLVNIYILLQDYQYAYKLLGTIDVSTIDSSSQKLYSSVLNYLKHFLGIEMADQDKEYYKFRRLLGESEDEMIEHVTKHVCIGNDDLQTGFFRYTDLKMLVQDALDKIDGLNPNIDNITCKYALKLDSPIAFINGRVTTDLGVTTLLNSKNIITMYPISLSPEFDSEGYLKNEQLRIKRGM